MRHEIKGDSYYVFNDVGETLLKITLTDLPGDQFIIETPHEVYGGPAELINFGGGVIYVEKDK